MKGCEQVFYNMTFTNIENLVSAVVFQARRLDFSQGWTTVMNAIGLPKYSAFRDLKQIPLTNDPLVQAPTQEQLDKEDDEEGEESPSMAELVKQIDSHVKVIDMDNGPLTSFSRVRVP